MEDVAAIVLLLKFFENVHPNSTIPAELDPIAEPDSVRLELFFSGVGHPSHIPWQPDVAGRSGASREPVEPHRTHLFRMPRSLMGDLMRQGLAEQPAMVRLR